MEISDIDLMIKSLQEIKKQIKKRDKLSERALKDITPKRRQAISCDVTYCGHYIEEETFRLHTLIVKNNIANPFDDEYYQDVFFEPSPFHKYTCKRPHPLKN